MALRTSRGFQDRAEAGRQLARRLATEPLDDAVVVGLARGGVVVAAEVARELRLPLDALAVRKVGHPLEPEYGIGAVTPGGGVYVRAHDGLTDGQVATAVQAAQRRAEDLDRRLHARRNAVSVAGKSCLLVDDGLATGATMIAAVRWARAQRAGRVVVAVPVGAADTVAVLRGEADGVVVLAAPEAFGAVGLWYRSFLPVEEHEVLELLGESGAAPADPRVAIPVGAHVLPGELALPDSATGIVLFAHGSGSGRASPRNRFVAHALNAAGLGTLLFDLLTEGEELDRANVFDIPLLGGRLAAAHRWLRTSAPGAALPFGYFGASTGAAAALQAAAELAPDVRAVVSRGGRPDLAGESLGRVQAPTLLVVGGRDDTVLELNRQASAKLRCPHELAIVPGATHLFEEPGTLQVVAELAVDWFERHLTAS